MTPWERYDGFRTTTPQLSIYRDGSGHINAAADREFLADVEEVTVFVDADAHKLAFVPGGEGPQPLSLTRSGQAGADINIKGVLTSAGVDVDDLDGTVFVDLVEETVAGATGVVCDLSGVVDKETETDPEVVEQPNTDADTDETPPETQGADGESEDEEVVDADDEIVDQSTDDTHREPGPNTDEVHEDADPEANTDEVDESHPKAALRTFLASKTNGGGRDCLEARQIAEHVPLSGQQVGHWMGQLRDESETFDITHESHEDHDGWDRARWAFERVDDAETAADDAEDDTDHQVGEELPEDLDDATDAVDGDDPDADVPVIEDRLPEGVTVDDVHAAREDHRNIEDIAEELEMPDDIGQTRTVLMLTDNYSGVREGAHSRRGST